MLFKTKQVLYKTKPTTMPTMIYKSYPCPICSKTIAPGEKYMFIDSLRENGNNYISGYTCIDEKCVQMRIFQMME